MDRDRRRDREVPPEDQYGTGRGQSYRPGNAVRERTPPRMDSYRARSPHRRTDYMDSYKADTYRAPARPRSRSPPRRDDYRRRSLSTPRYDDRGGGPRGGDSYRGRPRDYRDERDRGYLPLKRGREASPMSSRGRRTPPRAVEGWRRPRSPVHEPRQDYVGRDQSTANSAATSRRSSPPVHPSRIVLQPATYDDRPHSSRASPRDPEPYRAADVEPKARNTPLASDYAREPKRVDDVPPRAPPTGPSGQRSSAMPPPTGPAAVSAPSGPRASVAPPAGPRGAPAPRGDFAPRGRGAFGGDVAPRGRGGFGVPFRGSRGGGPPTGPGFGRGDGGFGRSASESFNNQDPPFGSRPPPSGPRNSSSQAAPLAFRQASAGAPPTQPRSQRYPSNGEVVADSNIPTGPKLARRPTEPVIAAVPLAIRPHPALAELPKIIEGGQKAEPLIDRTKLNKLEDEAEKLRKQIEERETRKRKTLRDWDRMTRETEAASLRSELAEEALKQLNGEAESQAAF